MGGKRGEGGRKDNAEWSSCRDITDLRRKPPEAVKEGVASSGIEKRKKKQLREKR